MNLKELAKSKGTNLNKLAEKCGVPASTLYAIASGDTNFDNVGISLFMRLADALDMKPEELYGREPKKQEVSGALLTASERALLALYRSMDPVGRASLIEQAEFLSARHPLNTEAETA